MLVLVHVSILDSYWYLSLVGDSPSALSLFCLSDSHPLAHEMRRDVEKKSNLLSYFLRAERSKKREKGNKIRPVSPYRRVGNSS